MKNITAKRGVYVPKLSKEFKVGDCASVADDIADDLIASGSFEEGGTPKKKPEKKHEKQATSFDKKAMEELRAKAKGEVKDRIGGD